MRKALFPLMVLLVCTAVFSLEISVPENVSANVNWSLYSNLSSLNYDKIQVFLDDARVYEASFGSNPFTDQSKIVSAYHYEKQVSISFFGLAEGTHPVSLKIFRDGAEIASASKDIVAFNPYTKEATERLEQNVSALEAIVDEKIGTNGAITSSLAAIQAGISSLEEQGSSKDEKIAVLESSVKKLQGQLAAQSAVDDNISASLEEIKFSLAKIEARFEGDGQQPLFTGFVSFVRGNPVLALGLLVVVIILVVLVIIRKKRLMDRNYLFEPGEIESEVHGVEEPSSVDGVTSKGKWSSGSQEKPAKAEKSASKVSWGDLIKKERP
ncbi:MAG: hypothetical protein NT067_00335 [Candidatus Diapherotrites archaeon]|nr:hypothetical protein [Candidatus Diapherotrites archaeon]